MSRARRQVERSYENIIHPDPNTLQSFGILRPPGAAREEVIVWPNEPKRARETMSILPAHIAVAFLMM